MPTSTENISFSHGRGANLGRSKNITESFEKFAKCFEKPFVTDEDFHEFREMNDKEQRRLKASNGWFLRSHVVGGVRNRQNVRPSDLLTFDGDYATPEFMAKLRTGEILPGVRLMAHTTRSHTPEKPSVRIVIPLASKVTSDGYGAVCRIAAPLADPEMAFIDKVSFRPAQMMFLPTVSKDMEQHHIYYLQDGSPLDHEELIASWEKLNGDSLDLNNLPKTPDEGTLRKPNANAADPRKKANHVGDFCRAYSITELILGKEGEEGILADIYDPVEWNAGEISRMTFIGGATSNGAVVYDDSFVFSHHGSDPTQEQLCNAYDLVRIHKFGNLDARLEDDAPMAKRPSVKAMADFLKSDKHYKEQQTESRYDLEEMLSDDDVEYETEEQGLAKSALNDQSSEERKQYEIDYTELVGARTENSWSKRKSRQGTRLDWAKEAPKKWLSEVLELTADGKIKSTIHNIAYVILYDPRLFRKVAFNLFSEQIVMVGDFKSKMELIPDFKCDDKINGEDWQEINDLIVRTIIEAPAGKGQVGYGIKVGKEMVHDAVRVAARRNSFHPILEYLNNLRSLESLGVPDIVERLFIDYFGCEDSVYYRDLSRLILTASVARVEEPGCKFDFTIIIEGEQGTGKSSSIKALYDEAYFGEIDGDLGNIQKVAEQIAGKWVIELPELSAMLKSEANDAKAFMSRQHDDVRMVYDRNKSKFPRQCVIWGTTNNDEYLRDITGGRRYLIVKTGEGMIDMPGIARDRDILWQAACRSYDEMRETTNGDLPLYLQGEAAELAKLRQERARKTEAWELWLDAILEWMDEELTLLTLLENNGFEMADSFDETRAGIQLDSIVCQVAFSREDALQKAFGQQGSVPSNTQAHQFWTQLIAELKKRGWSHRRVRVAGVQKTWMLRPDTTSEEQFSGFRMLYSAEAHRAEITENFSDPEICDLI